MLTSYAITMIRQYTGKLAAYATYCAGGKEHRVPVQSVAMEGDSDVSINVLIAPDGEENVTVTEVRLYDEQNQMVAQRDEDITIDPSMGGVLYRFRVKVKEE